MTYRLPRNFCIFRCLQVTGDGKWRTVCTATTCLHVLAF